MVKTLNPQNYDYLWTDHDVNFIFVSGYLFKKFRATDMVLIYEPQEGGVKFFLGKADRRRFAAYGLRFYRQYFAVWRRKIEYNIKRGQALVRETEKDKNKISRLSDRELGERIKSRAALFQALGENYFYTEFFFLDKVEALRSAGQKIKNFSAMGRIKFRARSVLNNFYNYQKIFAPYVQAVARRQKRKDLAWLSYEEILSLLAGRPVPLSKRDKTNWVLTRQNNWQPISGPAARQIARRFNKHFFKLAAADTIKATVANKGVYTGRVRLVRTLFSDKIISEIKKVRAGEVLVAETTGPEMMLGLQKAGAIVTDEGGLTSHAAIVARELRVPCLVGAKVATKILHDGNLVQVDADKGIIKILKKN